MLLLLKIVYMFNTDKTRAEGPMFCKKEGPNIFWDLVALLTGIC